MAIKISGTDVINNQKELASGLVSAYDVVSTTSTNRTLVNREHCTVTGTTSRLISLPASPSAGNEVVVVVEGQTSHTISGNGKKIMGDSSDLTLDIPYVGVRLIYVNSTIGWRIS
jgi:hypothetical protein